MAPQRQTEEEENPFMAMALSPSTQVVKLPDMTRPLTREQQQVLRAHQRDIFKEASKIHQTQIANEGINMVAEHTAGRFQQSQNYMAKLEEAADPTHKVYVVNYNKALSVAAGNGTIRAVNNLVEALNKIVESDEPVVEYVVPQPPPTTVRVRQKVGLKDAVRGFIEMEKK